MSASRAPVRSSALRGLPSGTTATRYAFRHALYRETLAATMPARRKAEAHRRIGPLERAYGERSAELAAAFRHIEDGEPLYDVAEDRDSALTYGHDAKAAAISYRAILLWSFGRIDDAPAVAAQAVAHARTLEHPMSVAFVLINAAWLRFLPASPRRATTRRRP